MKRFRVMGRNGKILGFVEAGTLGMAEVFAQRTYGITWAYLIERVN